MNVLIIPEDFTKDQYVLRPIVKAMLEHLGKQRAKVEICTDPRLGGIGEALKWERIATIIDRYRMVDLFVLIVDRDGDANRRERLNYLERNAKEHLEPRRFFVSENAWQEVEAWLLAGHSLPTSWRWEDLRNERDVKDVYYVQFAAQRGLLDAPYEGRKSLGVEAAARYDRISKLCSEVADLEQRIGGALTAISG